MTLKEPQKRQDDRPDAASDSGEAPKSTILNTPWTLDFDHDGTEDLAIIRDAAGETLATSRPFWKPAEGDSASPTLEAMRAMAAAPELLSDLEDAVFELEQWVETHPEADARTLAVIASARESIAKATGRAA